MKTLWGTPLDLERRRVVEKAKNRFTKILFVANLEEEAKNNKALRQESNRIWKILNARMPTTLKFVEGPKDLEDALAEFSRDNTLIMNWAESFPAWPNSAPDAAAIIEREGFAHTASPSATQNLVADRAETYQKFESLNIPAPNRMKVYSPPDVELWKYKYPCLIRPNREHGSLGLKQVGDKKQAEDAVGEMLQKYEAPALMVEYISGREFSVGLWSDGTNTETFPIGERDFSDAPDDVEDEQDKAPTSEHAFDVMIVPPKDLPKQVSKRMLDYSKTLFTAFNIKIYGRMDFRLPKNSLEPIPVDCNPEPDVSHDSSLAAIFTKGGQGTHRDLIMGIIDRTITYYAER